MPACGCVLPLAANENALYDLDANAVDGIGHRLRSAFAHIADAPIPDDIRELVENLLASAKLP